MQQSYGITDSKPLEQNPDVEERGFIAIQVHPCVTRIEKVRLFVWPIGRLIRDTLLVPADVELISRLHWH